MCIVTKKDIYGYHKCIAVESNVICKKCKYYSPKYRIGWQYKKSFIKTSKQYNKFLF